jgi:hypothetical protein
MKCATLGRLGERFLPIMGEARLGRMFSMVLSVRLLASLKAWSAERNIGQIPRLGSKTFQSFAMTRRIQFD